MKRRKVEYRWFPATAFCGLLGGIVAPNEAEARTWVDPMTQKDNGFCMVRVRMEYDLPRAAQRRRTGRG